MWQEQVSSVLSGLVNGNVYPQVVPIGVNLPAISYFLVSLEPIICKAGDFEKPVFGLHILHTDYKAAHLLLASVKTALAANRMKLRSARDGYDKDADLVQIVCTVKIL